jgi:hypothetical protein
MEKKMLEAQAKLMHKAALLMLVRNDGEMVTTSCYPSIESFSFEYGTIKLDFSGANPFSQEQVDAVLLAMDDMLEDERKRAEKVVYTINHWRGM